MNNLLEFILAVQGATLACLKIHDHIQKKKIITNKILKIEYLY